jgi:NAD+ synthase (glutamine-hydrolysing)
MLPVATETSNPPVLEPEVAPRPAELPPADLRRVALAQIAPALGDRARNLAMHLEGIARARAEGADMVVFPELSLTGYYLRDMVPDVGLAVDSPELARLAEAAGPMAVIAGFVEEAAGDRFYNSSFLIERGRIAHVHRKVYLPTYGMFDEQRYFAAGNRIRVCETARFGRLGILVCEDFWHLSAVTVMQAEEVDMLVCVANSPARGATGAKVDTAATYERMCKTYAQLLGAVVVLVNRVGFEDGVCFWGGSMAVGPGGDTLAEAPQFDEALTIAVIDPADLRRQRLINPLARDERLLTTIEELKRIKRRRYEI